MRLLAFSARWFEKTAGDVVFTKGEDPSDGAYLILDGEADFYLPVPDKEDQHIRTLGPGAMVGELALILDEPRSLSMKARTNISGLRIGGEEFLVVLQNDPQTAFNMLQVVTRYLTKKTS
ncbi:MAG: cyclic nucleotide-binding domain-containing protein [Amylibacter sp.]|nr:cyclic nucleotide-binding domain-containing protein [Amylibacter sp.]